MQSKKAIKQFKLHLSDSPALLDIFEGLGGKTLTCHCPIGVACHGDAIVDAYRDRFLADTGKPPTDDAIRQARAKRERDLDKVVPKPLAPPPFGPR